MAVTGHGNPQHPFENMRLSSFLPWFGACVLVLAGPSFSQVRTDFDLDGWDDLVIGVPNDGSFEVFGIVFPGPGAVNLVYGGSSGLGLVGNDLLVQSAYGESDENGDQFGASMTAGDFDGNGYPDLAIGMPHEDDTFVSEGAVLVILNDAAGFGSAGTRVLRNIGFPCTGPAPGDHYGEALTSADFNQDGFDDLAIGIPNHLVGADEAGAVHVRYGDPSGFLTVGGYQECWHQDSPGMADSAERYDHFGSSLAAGDFDGDGHPDLAVGVPDEDLVVQDDDAGAINVLYGGLGGLSASPVLLEDIECEGPEDGDHYGFALRAGDFDKDGADDVAVGIPFEDIGMTVDAGAVDIRYGILAGGFEDGDCFHLDDPAFPTSAETNDRFGYDLAEGNFDAKGPTDLAIGAPRKDILGTPDAGAVLVLFASGTQGLQRTGFQAVFDCSIEPFDYFGQQLSSGNYGAPPGGTSLGDDLVIGAPSQDVGAVINAGSIQVRYGGIGGDGKLGPGHCGDQDMPGLAGVASVQELFASGLAK